MKRATLIASLSLVALLWGENLTGEAKKPPVTNVPKFSRAELIVLNLNRGPGSSGYAISESQKQTKDMLGKLEKALRQMKVADKQYAKSRGRPDDRMLSSPQAHLEQAIETARKLEAELAAARSDLNESIKQALAMP